MMIVKSIILNAIFSGCSTTVKAKAPPTDPKPLSWNISLTDQPTAAYDSNGNPVMQLQYFMSNREYDVKVLKDDCENSTSVPELNYIDYFSDTMGFLDVMANLTINQADIEASDIWNSTSGDLDGSFSFCVQSSLYLNENKTEENVVSRSEHIFNVDVDKQSGFEITDIGIIVVGPETNDDFVVDFEGNVTAYQCDPVTLDPIALPPPPLGPFDVLNICVEETSNENITIGSILDLTLEQNETYTTFVAIEDGAVKPGYDEVVMTTCMLGKCLAQIQLINAFFSSDQAYSIDVTGTVLLSFSSRRLLGRSDGAEVEIPLILGGSEEKNEMRQLMYVESQNADFKTNINLLSPVSCDESVGLVSTLISIIGF